MKRIAAGLFGLLVIAVFSTMALAKHHKPAVDPPSLGADCGTGASFIGTDTAIRITTGTDFNGICTISFSATANRICSAMNETAGGTDGNPYPMGCKEIDTSTIQTHSAVPVGGGDTLTVMVATYP